MYGNIATDHHKKEVYHLLQERREYCKTALRCEK